MEFRKEVAYVPATLENESKKSEDTYFVFTLKQAFSKRLFSYFLKNEFLTFVMIMSLGSAILLNLLSSTR